MSICLRGLIAGASLLGLASCQTSPPAPSVPAVQPAVPAAPAPGAREYRVDQARSLLRIFAYRGGSMARVGHNHVIASRHLEGTIHLATEFARTSFDISFPVAALTIDEPALREEAGVEFPPAVPQNARDGTRRNMLSTALLDGERYPRVRLRAVDAIPTGDGYDARVEVTLKDQVHVVRVPVRVVRSADELTATGEFALRQSELGLQPFAVMMGALTVLDEMRVRFEIVAR